MESRDRGHSKNGHSICFIMNIRKNEDPVFSESGTYSRLITPEHSTIGRGDSIILTFKVPPLEGRDYVISIVYISSTLTAF